MTERSWTREQAGLVALGVYAIRARRDDPGAPGDLAREIESVTAVAGSAGDMLAGYLADPKFAAAWDVITTRGAAALAREIEAGLLPPAEGPAS